MTLKQTLLALFILFLSSFALFADKGNPPNFLFIFADDQCYETIAELGHTDIDTPNLDRLVREGTTFTNAYNMGGWNGAICIASRTMINTGRFLWRAHKLDGNMGMEIRQQQTWPQLLRASGYEAYLTGKWHVAADVGEMFNFVAHKRPGMPAPSDPAVYPDSYQRPKIGQPDTWTPQDPKYEGFWAGGKHWSEVIADDAEMFLARAKNSEKQFFMYLAFNAPHDPRQYPLEYGEPYPMERIAMPENYLEEYPHMEGMGAGRDLRDEKLAPWPRTEYAVKSHRRDYYAIITHMDAQIGRILDSLEATGKADNTYIIFTADHGLAVGRHGFLGKQNMYEHSLKPPLILMGPSIPEGKQIDARVYYQDLMPTTLELAGTEIPDFVEFKSLMPLIKGERDEQYERIYGAYREHQRAVIEDDFKLIYYPKIDQYRLFNLAEDPFEMNDLIEDAQYAEQLLALKKALVVLMEEMDDPITEEMGPVWDTKKKVTLRGDFRKVEIPASYDGALQSAIFRASSGDQKQPLIVRLHTWSGNFEQQDPLAEKIADNNWNYIFPDFRGANRTPQACMSDAALSDLEDAVDFAIKMGNVDLSKIFVVGVSGGGNAALGMYLKSKHPVHTYFSWVPISDLETWYWQSNNRKNKYAGDILDCLDAGGVLDVELARERSPYFWSDNSHPGAKLEVFAGVNDGYIGSVPISHSLRFFNKLAREQGYTDALISPEDQLRLLERGYSIDSGLGEIGDRAIIDSRKIPGVELTVFDGAHEMLVDYMFDRLVKLVGI